MLRSFSLSCLVLFTASPFGSAQVTDPNIRRGALSDVGTLFTVSAGTRNPLAISEELYVKPAGDITLAPPAWPATQTSSIGNYHLPIMFPNFWQYIEIDAMSSGNAFIKTFNGLITLETQWAAATISVGNAAKGESGNGWLERRIGGDYSTRLSPGADLATHYVNGSQGIAGDLVGKSFIMQLAEHGGLTEEQDIDSLDIAMGVIESATGEESRLLFTNTRDFYFSLSADSVTALGMAGVTVFAVNEAGTKRIAADAADIYRMRWLPHLNRWTYPKVIFSAETLGLTRGVDDVDAIDVSAVEREVVFSTTLVDHRPQLLVYEQPNVNPASPGGVFTLTSIDGPITSAGFGLRDDEGSGEDEGDDVDAVCFFDPEIGHYDDFLGTPVEGETIGKLLGISATLDEIGEYRFQVTGGTGPGSSTGGTSAQIPPTVTIQYATLHHVDMPSATVWADLVSDQYLSVRTELEGTLTSSSQRVYFRGVVTDTLNAQILGTTWVSAFRP